MFIRLGAILTTIHQVPSMCVIKNPPTKGGQVENLLTNLCLSLKLLNTSVFRTGEYIFKKYN
jgi:hypothetical protein